MFAAAVDSPVVAVKGFAHESKGELEPRLGREIVWAAVEPEEFGRRALGAVERLPLEHLRRGGVGGGGGGG